MKTPIEVRAYVPGHTQYGSDAIGAITGDFGQYTVVETVERKLTTRMMGNFAPIFCRYKGREYTVHSDDGDVSDPFRRSPDMMASLFIEIKPERP